MKNHTILAAALASVSAFAAPAAAQNAVVDATTQSQSGAISGSNSQSGSASDQTQGQVQGQTAVGTVGQSATNQQGVAVSNTFNSTNRKFTEVNTNAAVPLAASSSFSSDFCGATASGGVSAAPIGISIGGAKPVYDKNCQGLRRAEKFGMAAANAHNMGQAELAGRLMSLMIWSICTSDTETYSEGKADKSNTPSATEQACSKMLLLGNSTMPTPTAGQPSPAPSPQAAISRNGKPTPEAVSRAVDDKRQQVASLNPAGLP